MGFLTYSAHSKVIYLPTYKFEYYYIKTLFRKVKKKTDKKICRKIKNKFFIVKIPICLQHFHFKFFF